MRALQVVLGSPHTGGGRYGRSALTSTSGCRRLSLLPVQVSVTPLLTRLNMVMMAGSRKNRMEEEMHVCMYVLFVEAVSDCHRHLIG